MREGGLTTGVAGLDSGRGKKVGERGGWGLGSSESGVAVPDGTGESFRFGTGFRAVGLVVCLSRPSLRFGRGGGTRCVVLALAVVVGCMGGGFAGSFLSFSCVFFSSLQFAALSPNALAIRQRPLLLGGTGGFSPLLEGVIDGGRVGTSSSHTFSTMPVRTKAHRVHVERRRARHHPLVQRG